MILHKLLILSVLFTFGASVCTYNTFSDMKIIVETHGEPYPMDCSIEECIDEKLCQYSQVRRISIVDKNIKFIGTGAVKNLPKFEHLSFMSNNLENVDKKAFINLPKLKNLVISQNKLTTFPDVFENLQSLEKIYLDGNFISSIKNGILAFPNLRYLNLAKNNLRGLFSNVFKEKLENLHYLSVEDNDIIYIEPNFFDYIPNLQIFSIANNKLRLLSPESKISKLIKLDLGNNDLQFLDINLLNKFTRLQKLRIELNPWNCVCYKELSNWINSQQVNVETKNKLAPLCVQPNNNACTYKIDHESLFYYKDKTINEPLGPSNDLEWLQNFKNAGN